MRVPRLRRREASVSEELGLRAIEDRRVHVYHGGAGLAQLGGGGLEGGADDGIDLVEEAAAR